MKGHCWPEVAYIYERRRRKWMDDHLAGNESRTTEISSSFLAADVALLVSRLEKDKKELVTLSTWWKVLFEGRC